MLATITLVLALGAQIGFLTYQLLTQDRQTTVKHMMRIAAFSMFTLLLVLGVYWWGFRWTGLFLMLAVWAVVGAISILRKPKAAKAFKVRNAVFACIGSCALLTISMLPGLLFPQFAPIAANGTYTVESVSITMADDTRVDRFTENGEDRKLTVQFWYPESDGEEQYPLVLFSHGAFGYRGSNLSTFETLAANGYVVGSIDHSSHAFFAAHTDGSTTVVNTAFLNDAVAVTNDAYDAKTTYDKTHEWLALRTADMGFVLEQIESGSDRLPPELLALVDRENIGLAGHSLGGATAAQLGRTRSDVDAVVVLDGTMIGEEIDFQDGQAILNPAPYPVPLLNLYNESHYADAQQAGAAYANIATSTKAGDAYDIVIKGAGHLNFTDLPLFSPWLAGMLGTGTVDSRYCIETMNRVVLEFFNYALKGTTLHLQPEY